MVINPAKIFNDEQEYVSLFDLSKQQKYSLEFLLQAASRGQLKAFKMGDEWLTTLNWFNDYQKVIKKAVLLEISHQEIDFKNDWVNYLPAGGFSLKFVPQMVLILVIFSFFSFFLSGLVFSSIGHRLALASYQITQNKYAVGNYFLHYTNQVYGFGNNYTLFVVSNSINTTRLLSESVVATKQNTADVALALSQHIGQNKISDEFLTNKFSELTEVIKTKYQAVAGTNAIRNQIYFEAWENSSQSGH